jgi:hypothetical protein
MCFILPFTKGAFCDRVIFRYVESKLKRHPQLVMIVAYQPGKLKLSKD